MRGEQMHVILHGACLEQRAGKIGDDAAAVSVEFIADGIFNDAFAVFGGEDDVDEDLRERLRHGSAALAPLQGWVLLLVTTRGAAPGSLMLPL